MRRGGAAAGGAIQQFAVVETGKGSLKDYGAMELQERRSRGGPEEWRGEQTAAGTSEGKGDLKLVKAM